MLKRVAKIAVPIWLLILAILPASAQTNTNYIIEVGDTLGSIATDFCTSWLTIYNLNQEVIGMNPNYITAGSTIIVPNGCGATGGATTDQDAQSATGIYDRGARQYAMGTVVSGNQYLVEWGDTVFSISQRFGVPIELMWDSNEGASNLGLLAGTRIIIPGFSTSTDTSGSNTQGVGGSTVQPPATGGPIQPPTATGGIYDRGTQTYAAGRVDANRRYIVEVGDTVFSISQRFGVSSDQIWYSNEGASNRGLQAGDILIIPGFTTN